MVPAADLGSDHPGRKVTPVLKYGLKGHGGSREAVTRVDFEAYIERGATGPRCIPRRRRLVAAAETGDGLECSSMKLDEQS
jgi:hypothetical protein